MTRSSEELALVRALIAGGCGVGQISRSTGMPRSTVRDRRLGLHGRTERTLQGQRCERHDYGRLPSAPYSYLLGLYLGDGCIARSARTWRLRITMDAKYPGIIEGCAQAMEAVVPGRRAYRLARPSRCVDVSMYSKHWVCLFPQHAPGRKHERAIHLAPWQDELVKRETHAFIRGLIHSDGCRVVANDRGVISVRYHFSNRSEDIKGLLCMALDRLQIHWTRPSDRQIAVYRKADVRRLDEFIGEKR